MAVLADDNGFVGADFILLGACTDLLLLQQLAHDKVKDRDHQHGQEKAPAEQQHPDATLKEEEHQACQENTFEDDILQIASSAPWGSLGRENQAKAKAIRSKEPAKIQPTVFSRSRPSGMPLRSMR